MTLNCINYHALNSCAYPYFITITLRSRSCCTCWDPIYETNIYVYIEFAQVSLFNGKSAFVRYLKPNQPSHKILNGIIYHISEEIKGFYPKGLKRNLKTKLKKLTISQEASDRKRTRCMSKREASCH